MYFLTPFFIALAIVVIILFVWMIIAFYDNSSPTFDNITIKENAKLNNLDVNNVRIRENLKVDGNSDVVNERVLNLTTVANLTVPTSSVASVVSPAQFRYNDSDGTYEGSFGGSEWKTISGSGGNPVDWTKTSLNLNQTINGFTAIVPITSLPSNFDNLTAQCTNSTGKYTIFADQATTQNSRIIVLFNDTGNVVSLLLPTITPVMVACYNNLVVWLYYTSTNVVIEFAYLDLFAETFATPPQSFYTSVESVYTSGSLTLTDEYLGWVSGTTVNLYYYSSGFLTDNFSVTTSVIHTVTNAKVGHISIFGTSPTMIAVFDSEASGTNLWIYSLELNSDPNPIYSQTIVFPTPLFNSPSFEMFYNSSSNYLSFINTGIDTFDPAKTYTIVYNPNTKKFTPNTSFHQVEGLADVANICYNALASTIPPGYLGSRVAPLGAYTLFAAILSLTAFTPPYYLTYRIASTSIVSGEVIYSLSIGQEVLFTTSDTSIMSKGFASVRNYYNENPIFFSAFDSTHVYASGLTNTFTQRDYFTTDSNLEIANVDVKDGGVLKLPITDALAIPERDGNFSIDPVSGNLIYRFQGGWRVIESNSITFGV